MNQANGRCSKRKTHDPNRSPLSKEDGSPFKPSEKGLTLVLVLSLILLLGLVTVPVYTRTLYHSSSAFRESSYLGALHLAEAGIEEALWNLSYGEEDSWENWSPGDGSGGHTRSPSIFPDSTGAPIGEYEVLVENSEFHETYLTIGGLGTATSLLWVLDSAPIVTCRAGIPNLSDPGSEVRIVEIEATPRTVFSLGLFAEESLTLASGVSLESGPFGANAQIVGAGAPDKVEDRTDLKLPPTLALVNSAKTKNDNSGIPLAVQAPPCGPPPGEDDAKDDDDLVTICHKMGNSGKWKTMQVNPNSVAAHMGHGDKMGPCPGDSGSGQGNPAGNGNSNTGYIQVYDPSTQVLRLHQGYTLTLPGGTKANPKVYYFSEIDLNGGSLVTSGYVLLLSDGMVDLSQGSVINQCGAGSADSLVLFGAGNNQSIVVNTANGFIGAIYAPGANIETVGAGHIDGAAVGKNVTLSANTHYHYDHSLDRTGMLAHYEVARWSELPREFSQ